MKVITIIQEPEEIDHILRHLVKQGRPPPGGGSGFAELIGASSRSLDESGLYFYRHFLGVSRSLKVNRPL